MVGDEVLYAVSLVAVYHTTYTIIYIYDTTYTVIYVYDTTYTYMI